MWKRDIYIVFGTKIAMPVTLHTCVGKKQKSWIRGSYKIIWTLLDVTNRLRLSCAIYCTIIYTFWIFFLWHEVFIYTVFISSLSSNFSCPLDDDRASILRAILYHVLCSLICTSLKHFLLILHASVLATDRSTQGTKRWVKFQWPEWSM